MSRLMGGELRRLPPEPAEPLAFVASAEELIATTLEAKPDGVEDLNARMKQKTR